MWDMVPPLSGKEQADATDDRRVTRSASTRIHRQTVMPYPEEERTSQAGADFLPCKSEEVRAETEGKGSQYSPVMWADPLFPRLT